MTMKRESEAREASASAILSGILVCCIVVLPMFSLAAVYTVIQDGTGDFTSVGVAMDYAQTGDTIVVYPGVYYETVYFRGKDLIVQSVDPWDEAVVQGTAIDGSGRLGTSVVTFSNAESSRCLLSGLTIRNGNRFGGGGGGICGGWVSGRQTKASIRNCIIKNNVAACGGGIAFCGGEITNCRILDNRSDAGGGMFSCFGRIENCLIQGNYGETAGGGQAECRGVTKNCVIRFNVCGSSLGGGGVDLYDGVITGCLIEGNVSSYVGGGIDAMRGWIVNCLITGNSAEFGGGLSLSFSPHVVNCVISGNTASVSGGIDLAGMPSSRRASITNCVIAGNSARGTGDYPHSGMGGGLSGGICDVTDCIITGNTAALASSAAFDAHLVNCLVKDNTCVGAPGYGTGMCVEDSSLTFCTVVGNDSLANGLPLPNRSSFENTIIWGNEADAGEVGICSLPSYCCIEGWAGGGEGNTSENPLFVTGPRGDYYLSQTAAGQGHNSPCVDAGSATAEEAGIDDGTTRTDLSPDVGVADMGYHYPNYARGTVDMHSLLGHPRVPFCIENYGIPRSVDIYIGVMDPDGNVWSYTGSGFRRGNYATFPNVQLPAPFSSADLIFALDHHTLLYGEYDFVVVVTAAGSGFETIHSTSYVGIDRIPVAH